MKITRDHVPWGWTKFLLNSRLANILIPLAMIIFFGSIIPFIWMISPNVDLLWWRITATILLSGIILFILYLMVTILRNMRDFAFHFICTLDPKRSDERSILEDVQHSLGKGSRLKGRARYIHGEAPCKLVQRGKYRFYLRKKKYLFGPTVMHVFFGPIENKDDVKMLEKVDHFINDMKFGSWKGKENEKR